MSEEQLIAPERYPFLNTYVNALTMDETIAFAEEMIRRKIPTQHVVINALKVNLMQEDPELQRIVNSCPLINADGMSTVWARGLWESRLRNVWPAWIFLLSW